MDSSEIEQPKVPDSTTLRSTTHGDYVGFSDLQGTRAWLGIGYAQPPVGELRWKAPLPPEPHIDTVQALNFKNACPQLASAMTTNEVNATASGYVGSEDCLYLNVWSVPNAVGRPVMVWIHGGGNSIGSARSYPGAILAATENVVVVTINYRLGFLGWFNHPSVLEGSELDLSGNFGTLDTIRALEWVRQNIAVFGGDPDNVTIFGESAGGFNVLTLMASPLAEGLFHKAIVQSGRYFPEDPTHARLGVEEGGHASSASELVKTAT